MAKIKTYANDNTINANDRLIGTDFNDSDKTKNYLISALKNYILNGLDTRPYKVYTALLTQSGTSAPVATVLENTIGNIWFTYLDVGAYVANSNGLFKENKTATFITTSGFADDYIVRGARNDNNEVVITNIYISGNSLDSLYLTTIEIRVYN
jgi:hypothetical protein